MNSQAFSTAKAAYQRGDWAGAVSALTAAKAAGEVSGEVDHLRGNALMKLGMYTEAAEAYAQALADSAYAEHHAGALSCNRGRALVAAGRPDLAVSCFEAAVADSSYPTPYKAYLALGNLYARQGMTREAGTAWRNAAIDEANPDPAAALVKLGGCFMTLGRPVDAVEAYRTALDFSADGGQGPIYAELGQAYMASNRIGEAADAFAQATADGTYQLTPDQAAQLSAAQKALAAVSGGSSDTNQMLSQAGYGPSGTGDLDPLDPMGKSGEFIPNPEDTGFFSVTEEDLMKADKHERKMRRKHKRTGLKVFLVILVLVAALAGGGAYAYFKGYGWPTQEAVVTDMFSAASRGEDISQYLSGGVTDDTKARISAIIQTGSSAKVAGVERTATSATVTATASLPAGGEQSYSVSLVRDGIGWKVSGVELKFASQTSASQTTTGTLATTGATSAPAATSDAAASSPAATTVTAAANAATLSAS